MTTADNAWPERVETERLILRAPRLDDAATIFDRWARDTDVTRYMTVAAHHRLADSEHYVQRCNDGWRSGRELTWMLTTRDDPRPIGGISLRPDRHMASMGYILGRAYWGQGFMPEAGLALLDVARGMPALYRVWAVCDVENRASARVMEKLGMQREGILRRWIVHPNVSTTPRDVYCYAWIREGSP